MSGGNVTLHRTFWECGYRVFGLHEILPDGTCGCGQDHKDAKGIDRLTGKHPRVSAWQHTPVWSEDQLLAMDETDQFKTGYGVLCRGLLVIDVDERNGGVLSYQKLVDRISKVELCGLIVKTGSGGGSKHLYFKVPDGLALVQTHTEFPGVDFKSSGYVCGPDSHHVSGGLYSVIHGSVEDIDDAPPELLAILAKPDRHRADIGSGQTLDVSHADLADMLRHVAPDSDHETWLRCGMAVHHATGGTGFDVWDRWSQGGGPKYPGSDILGRRWHSFGKSANPVTLGTLIHYAEQGGWKQPVTFFPMELAGEAQVDAPAAVESLADMTKGIDLLRPPGLVGEVAAWIESQCRFKMEIASVGAALTAIGNIIGLRYTDDKDGVASNMFTFCVMGSGIGKESIRQAMIDCHHAAGVHAAAHGTIKSEQEIVRNLTRHQASYYLIDEVGYFLSKLKNAGAKGGATYLEGIIPTLMSVYGCVNGYYLVSGDVRDTVIAALVKEIAQIDKQLDAGDGPPKSILEPKKAALKHILDNIDLGIEKPFVSMMGFTTTVKFSDMVDYESAANGFFGRSLLFHDPNTVPPKKRGFRKEKMPDTLKNALLQLGMAGEYQHGQGGGNGRVEYYGERTRIPTDPAALKMLQDVDDELHQHAEDQKGMSGLESMILRAYEQVAKLSLILAAPEGVRTIQHVLWAYAFVLRDVQSKIRLVISNDSAKDDPGAALRAKLESFLMGNTGETLATIYNKMKGKRKEDVKKCLDAMIEAGIVEVSVRVHKYNKRESDYYRMR